VQTKFSQAESYIFNTNFAQNQSFVQKGVGSKIEPCNMGLFLKLLLLLNT